MFAPVASALRCLLRRAPVFAAAVAVAFGIQAFVALVWRLPHAVEVDAFIVAPIFTAFVYAYVAAGAAKPPLSTAAIWERFLERCWAVIAIDFVLSYVDAIGLAACAAGEPFAVAAGIGFLLLGAMLVYADASAVVDAEYSAWLVIPRSIARSFTASGRARGFAWAIAILASELLIFAAQSQLEPLLRHRGVGDASFWSQIPLGTVVLPALAALTAAAYLDAGTGDDTKEHSGAR